MHTRSRSCCRFRVAARGRVAALAAVAITTLSLAAQTDPASAALHAIPAFPLRTDGPVLTRRVAAGEPFTVAGPQGMLVGQQQGPFEAWILPVKLLSHLTIEADVEGYTVPLALNEMAREIEVRPDRTTITYAHIAVTVRQIMFAPATVAPAGTGAVVLFQVDAVRPVTLTLRFTPELREMWPKPSSGESSAEWVAPVPAAGSDPAGFYVLHSDLPSLAGAVALPGAVSGILAPYQERPQTHPLELILHVDPARDRNTFFPLLLAVGRTAATATNSALHATLLQLDQQLPALYAAHVAHYALAERELTSITTPDPALDAALTWAETSIDQLRAQSTTGELGLVAGYYASGDSARPGFGWYFGRDTLYTVYALDSYGDAPLARQALEFLLARQRADGKAMHEFSQTAPEVDWAALPYEYAAADATPLLLTTLLDYVRATGDLEFLRAHRDNVLRAWRFETAHDSDGDGIYDNAQGTGWVESWQPAAPEQEIYLALLDQQASTAMAELATLLDEPALAAAARTRATTLHATIEREYLLPHSALYAFSRNVDQPHNPLDASTTIFPAIAWWNDRPGVSGALDHPQPSLARWASHDLNTDWGTRDVAASDPRYDPISYHQGAVWPLFTGWAALAEYRGGHPLAAATSLMQNVQLTEAQDLGAVTELLSGAFFEPFGRSTSHQLWSSAMVATPLLRGLFGIDVDALTHIVTVTPHLPATWPHAVVHSLHIGGEVVDLDYRRVGQSLVITLRQRTGPEIDLSHQRAVTLQNHATELRLPLPAVEVEAPHALPLRGARTTQMKVLAEVVSPHALQLTLEGIAGTESTLTVQRNDAHAHVTAEGATLAGDALRVTFPATPMSDSGYVQQQVTLHW